MGQNYENAGKIFILAYESSFLINFYFKIEILEAKNYS